jgi:hypothetical protein
VSGSAVDQSAAAKRQHLEQGQAALAHATAVADARQLRTQETLDAHGRQIWQLTPGLPAGPNPPAVPGYAVGSTVAEVGTPPGRNDG